MIDASFRRLAGRMGRLVRKEVSTILRDRRTIITLVLMPLLLYPLLSIAFHQFLLAGAVGTEQGPEYIVALASNAEKEVIDRFLKDGAHELQAHHPPEGTEEPKTPPPRLIPQIVGDPREAVLQREADLGLRLRRRARPPPVNRRVEQALECEAYYLEGSIHGREALEHVQRLLGAAHRQRLGRVFTPDPNAVLLIRLLP